MTDCTRGDIRDLLPELVHDALDAEARADVERHVSLCADCAEELALLRRAQLALGHGPAVDAARIAAAVVQRSRGAERQRLFTRQAVARVAALAAAIVVMVAGAIAVLSRGEPERQLVEQPTPPVVEPDSPAEQPPLGPAPIAPRERIVAEAPPATAPAPSPVTSPATEQTMAVAFGGDDLGEAELELLLADLGSLDDVPDADPLSILPEIPVEVQ